MTRSAADVARLEPSPSTPSTSATPYTRRAGSAGAILSRVRVRVSAPVTAASQTSVCVRISSRGSAGAGSRVVSRACQELVRSLAKARVKAP
ncbi:hypothetical protein [Nonomuraea dietziae]|uniref:hypothetical protein n=1 Tax=Nonomuraea dietziae TaxID=65515 RepID=UPI0031E32CCC